MKKEAIRRSLISFCELAVILSFFSSESNWTRCREFNSAYFFHSFQAFKVGWLRWEREIGPRSELGIVLNSLQAKRRVSDGGIHSSARRFIHLINYSETNWRFFLSCLALLSRIGISGEREMNWCRSSFLRQSFIPLPSIINQTSNQFKLVFCFLNSAAERVKD